MTKGVSKAVLTLAVQPRIVVDLDIQVTYQPDLCGQVIPKRFTLSASYHTYRETVRARLSRWVNKIA